MALVGVSALAAVLKIGKGTVSKQAAAGKIPIADRDGKGNPLFDVEAVKAARDSNLNPLMRRDAPADDTATLPLPVTPEDEGDDDRAERRSAGPRPTSALVEQQRLEKQLKNRRLLRQVADDEGLLVLKAVVEETTMTLSRRTRDGVTGYITDNAGTLYAFVGLQSRTEAELRVWLREHTAQAFDETARAIAAEDDDEFDDADADVEQQSGEPVAEAAA